MGKHFNVNSWICPDDNVSVRQSGPPAYPYSYDMNFLLGSNVDQYDDGSATAWLGGQVIKMSRIKHPGNCIMMLEESSLTIDDGYMSLEGVESLGAGGAGAQTINGFSVYPGSSGHNWLAVWHDRNAHRPDEVVLASEATLAIPNPQAKGNVVFCDGHADYVTRAFAENPILRHWDPLF
jgi:prepilin-type processing-associated H-X9-DG protein